MGVWTATQKFTPGRSCRCTVSTTEGGESNNITRGGNVGEEEEVRVVMGTNLPASSVDEERKEGG